MSIDMDTSEELDIDSMWPKEYEPDWLSLESAKSDDFFTGASFELLKEALILATLACSIIPDRPYTRNEAILCGLILKSSMLGKAMLGSGSV